jgi:hypothetical protein
MWAKPKLRRDRWGKRIRALMVFAAASAVLSARNTPPTFAHASSTHSVKAVAHHDQRPRFDNNTPQSYPLPAAFALVGPTEIHAHLRLATAILVSFPTKGARFNRPPPIL